MVRLIAELMGVKVEAIRDNLKVAGRHVSVDAPFVNWEENSLMDVLTDVKESKPDSALMSTITDG